MKKNIRHIAPKVGKWTLFLGRWCWYVSAVIAVLMVAILFAVSRWLPELAKEKAEIEKLLRQESSLMVSIDELAPHWDGIHPGFRIKGLVLAEPGKKSGSVVLKEVRASIAFLPLLRGDIEINRIVLVQPELSIERLRDGAYKLSGFGPFKMAGKNNDEELLLWMGRLHELVIEDGRMIWHDRKLSEEPVVLEHVFIELENNGERRRLAIKADYPEQICRSCKLVADFTGNPFDYRTWDGRLIIEATDLNLGALPGAVSAALPQRTKGRFDVRIWSEFKPGRLESLSGTVSTHDLSLPGLYSISAPINIKTLHSDIKFQSLGDTWRLDMRSLSVGLKGPAWDAGRLHIESQPNASSLILNRADVDDLLAFVDSLKIDSPYLKQLAHIKPGGTVRNLRVDFVGDILAPEDYSIEADLVAINTAAYRKFPGVKGLSGHVSVDRVGGEFKLDNRLTEIDLPYMFRKPIVSRRITGDIDWRLGKESITISGRELKVFANDANVEGDFKFIIPTDTSQSPSLSLKLSFRDGNGDHAQQYFPVNIIQPDLLAWMDRSIKGGHITSGYAVFEGELKDFPFDNGKGIFKVVGHLENGVLDYLHGWAPITDLDMTIMNHGSELLVTGHHGKLGGMDISNVVVHGPNLRVKKERRLLITGEASGSLDDAFTVLRDSHMVRDDPKWSQLLTPEVTGKGQGNLSLAINLPLGADGPMTLKGEYRTTNASIDLPLFDLNAQNLAGAVRFDQAGPMSGNLNGKLLGGPTVLTLTRKKSALHFGIKGNWTAAGLSAGFGEWLSPYLRGSGAWLGRLRYGPQGLYIDIEADTKAMEIDFPQPLRKTKGEDSNFYLKTVFVNPEEHLIEARLGSTLDSLIKLKQENGYWRFHAAEIALGGQDAVNPYLPGIGLRAYSKHIDLDAWSNTIERSRSEQAGLPDIITHMHGQFDNTDMLNRRFGAITTTLYRQGDHWSGKLHGSAVSGDVKLSLRTPVKKVQLELDHLRLPNDTFRDAGGLADPRKFPELEIKAKQFEYGPWSLGELNMAIDRLPLGSRLSQMTLKAPEYQIFASGLWTRIADKHNAEMNILFDSADFGSTMARLGYPDQIKGGTTKVETRLFWRNAKQFSKENVNGNLKLSSKNGRFLQLETGAGRLLGIFNLSALGKLLRLDFASVFGKGFVYDSVKSSFKIEQGVAQTHDMKIKGASADLHVSGRIGIADEDYDLVVGVNPSLTDTLALTIGGMGAPQVGAAILLLKNLFNTKLVDGPRINYSIKGSWDAPRVERLGSPVLPEAPEDEQEE